MVTTLIKEKMKRNAREATLVMLRTIKDYLVKYGPDCKGTACELDGDWCETCTIYNDVDDLMTRIEDSPPCQPPSPGI